MTTAEYSSGVVVDAFWYAATKETAKYLVAGMTPEEIRERALQRNLYQCNTPARFARIYGTIMRRLNAIPKEAVVALAESTLSTGKSIILLAIMRTDRLFCEFITEVFTPKLRQGDFNLTMKEVNAFFSYKAQQSEIVGNWSEQTILRMKRAYLSTLVNAGLIMRCCPIKESPILIFSSNNEAGGGWEAIKRYLYILSRPPPLRGGAPQTKNIWWLFHITTTYSTNRQKTSMGCC